MFSSHFKKVCFCSSELLSLLLSSHYIAFIFAVLMTGLFSYLCYAWWTTVYFGKQALLQAAILPDLVNVVYSLLNKK